MVPPDAKGPKIRAIPKTALALAGLLGCALGPPAEARGRLVPIEARGDPADRGPAALRRTYEDTYHRPVEGLRLMTDDAYTPEGAFYAFHKAAALLLADPDKVPPGAWFDPEFDGAESGVRLDMRVPEGRGTMYAPGMATLDRMRDLFERRHSATRLGQDEKLGAIDAEFLDLMEEEIETMAALQEEAGGVELTGVGSRLAGDGAGPIRLDPTALRAGLAARRKGASPSGSPGAGAVHVNRQAGAGGDPPDGGPLRAPPPEVTAYLKRAIEGMNQPMTYQERFEFEMGLEGRGFELSAPADPRKGVRSYNPYQANPFEVMAAGASNLSSRPRRRSRRRR